jgi:anti-anti-sigma factor
MATTNGRWRMNAINSLEFVSGLWRRGSVAAKEKGASGFGVELELRGPAAVLHIAGRLTADRVEEVQKGLKQAKKKEADRIVVDLSACPYLDSAGLAALVAALGKVKKTGGTFSLVGLSPQLRSLLRLARLEEVFDTRDTVEAALAE